MVKPSGISVCESKILVFGREISMADATALSPHLGVQVGPS
jgi:hypothetical protein